MMVSIVSSNEIVSHPSELSAQTILTPFRYVGIEDVKNDAEWFEEKMARFTGEFYNLLTKGRKAEEEIRRQLKSVGFEVWGMHYHAI